MSLARITTFAFSGIEAVPEEPKLPILVIFLAHENPVATRHADGPEVIVALKLFKIQARKAWVVLEFLDCLEDALSRLAVQGFNAVQESFLCLVASHLKGP